MRSADHARIGGIVGAIAIGMLARDRSLPEQLGLWGYSVLLSVFIDLDHFVLARLKTGEWTHLRRALSHPLWAVTRQDEVFPDVSITIERLVSHVVVGGVLVAALRPVSRSLSSVSAIVLVAHLVADLLYETGLVRRDLQGW